MPDPAERQRLLEIARQAMRRDELHQATVPDLESQSLSVGDVLRLPQTAGFDVEWVLLQPLTSGEGFLVVEADAGELVGAADVKVPEGGSSGDRVVRCRHAVELPVQGLQGARRVDILPKDSLQKVHSRFLSAQDEAFEGSILGQEEEASLDYREWLEDVVLPAVAALERAAKPAREALRTQADDSLEEEREEPAPMPIPFPPPEPAPAPWLRWGLAAAVLLAALGLGYGAWTQLRLTEVQENLAEKIRSAQEDLVAEHRRELDRLAAQRQASERAYEEQVAAAKSEAERLEGSVAELREDLSAAEKRSFLSSPMIAMVRNIRGGPVEVTGDPGGSHVLVILSNSDLELAIGSRIRATLRRQGSSEILHRTGDLAFQDSAIFLAYPTTVMTPGKYTLRLEVDEGDGYRSYRDLSLEVPTAGG